MHGVRLPPLLLCLPALEVQLAEAQLLPCSASRFTNKRVTVINSSPLFAKTVRCWDQVT
jgi:hypothetical protein